MTLPVPSSTPTQTIEVHSDTLPELFEAVGLQFFARLINPSLVGEALREKIGLQAPTKEALLEDWVNTLLEFVRTQRMVFGQFKIDLKIEPKRFVSLTAEALGELLDVQRHELSQDPALIHCKKVVLRKDSQKYHAEIVLTK